MDAALRAGIAIYNAGHHHAAHDAWEDRWLELESGTDDERLLHGLIQFTAVVHHAQRANWEGVRGLAESAAGYLDGLPADHRGVNVGAVRPYLEAVADDPEHVERAAPPRLEHGGRALELDDLDIRAAAAAAPVLAEAIDGYDEDVVARAVDLAGEAVTGQEAGAGTGEDRFVALVVDFVGDEAHRELVYDRLRAHVERHTSRLDDVGGLFD